VANFEYSPIAFMLYRKVNVKKNGEGKGFCKTFFYHTPAVNVLADSPPLSQALSHLATTPTTCASVSIMFPNISQTQYMQCACDCVSVMWRIFFENRYLPFYAKNIGSEKWANPKLVYIYQSTPLFSFHILYHITEDLTFLMHLKVCGFSTTAPDKHVDHLFCYVS